MNSRSSLRSPRAVAALLATLPFALVAHPVAAQTSYPVVQATPPPAQADLSRALQRLARVPGDFDALVAAGKAALALDDVDAAIGFFGRADVVRPGDPQVKAGLAGANLKSGRPIEAIELFDQAIAAGVQPATIAGDRGLAYDLVGDNVSAQAQYRLALSVARDEEISRRLGLSQAISGDQRGFEATLLPLLQNRDFAAYRARAFGLAILGKEDEAVSIAEAVMPRDLSARMAPYLRYMPKLTRAQQAAAANLGNFPRAAQIGRDDPRFAQYAGPQVAAPVGATGNRLAPAGEPLGPRGNTARPARQSAASGRARQAAPPPPPPPPPPPTARSASRAATASSPPPPPPVKVERAPVSRRAILRGEQRVGAVKAVAAPQSQAAAAQSPEARLPASAAATPPVRIGLPAAQDEVRPVVVAELPPSSAAPSIELPAVQAAPPPPPPPPPPSPPPPPPPPSAASPSEPITVLRIPAGAAPVQEETVSLESAFAEFGAASGARAPAAGAVDITAIKPRTERPDPPKASAPPPPPPPPAPKAKVPSRVWVQVATGRDVKALAFDWRKFSKAEPKLLGKREAYTAPWGQTRRLVTGPFDSARDANQFVADLKKAGMDAFVFTSDEGEDVTPLK